MLKVVFVHSCNGGVMPISEKTSGGQWLASIDLLQHRAK